MAGGRHEKPLSWLEVTNSVSPLTDGVLMRRDFAAGGDELVNQGNWN